MGRELSPELKAAIILFYSLLDEQRRRFDAGLESLRLGRRGDRQLADFLDLDPYTVARGRQQLLAQDVEVDRARKAGGGRKPVGKKRRILSDSGGSNSCSSWAWKIAIQAQVSNAFDIAVTIAHHPTGASRWNPAPAQPSSTRTTLKGLSDGANRSQEISLDLSIFQYYFKY